MTAHEKIILFLALMVAAGILIGWLLGRSGLEDRLDEAWRDGYEQGCDDENASYDRAILRMAATSENCREAVPVDPQRPDPDARGPRSLDAPRALAPAAGDGFRPGDHAGAAPEVPEHYPDGRRVGFTYGAGTGYEDEPLPGEPTFGRTIYQELAVLDAESDPDGLDVPPAPSGESGLEWLARMDREAADWCARVGIEHEPAWSA